MSILKLLAGCGIKLETEVGAPAAFSNNTTSYDVAATYDTVNNKVVIVYRDNTNNDIGKAVVGTVSGTSISFGTPVTFESIRAFYPQIVFDSANGKVVVVYSRAGLSGAAPNFLGTARVGTVSGTTISFGGATDLIIDTTLSMAVAYDITNGKVVVSYAADPDGRVGKSVVGTVSGTSISFGAPVTFVNAAVSRMACTYDSTNSKVIIIYQEGNFFYKAIVGTVSGTSISFGTPETFRSTRLNYFVCCHEPSSNRLVISYQDNSTQFGEVIVGTVSGTSLSFGTAVVFNNASTPANSIVADSNNSSVVIAYHDGGNLNYGTAIVGTVSGTTITFDTPLVFKSANTFMQGITYDPDNKAVVIAYADESVATPSLGTASVIEFH
jgi:hypothetical protein